MPEISVIVPVFNVECYLQECIDSILAQTFTDIEIILVDDGSTDQCGVMCDMYAEKDSRIHVIHKKNGGISSARNTGIDASQGKYLCFVDSDDTVSPDYCKELYDALVCSSADFSVCAVYRFQDGETANTQGKDNIHQIVDTQKYLRMQLERRTEFGVWNKLLRHELFDSLKFAEGKLNEDVIFSADLLKVCKNGAVLINRQLYNYRQRIGGIVSSQSQKGSTDFLNAGEYLLITVRKYAPDLYKLALKYAIDYPWAFVDPIYVCWTFRENQAFLISLQRFLKSYIREYSVYGVFDSIRTNRMRLLAKSKLLYAFNAYSRLFRVYLYRLFDIDAYSDGHGI